MDTVTGHEATLTSPAVSHVLGDVRYGAVSGSEILLGAAALALGGALHGSVGFGMGLVAAPLLVLINPELIPGPMLCAGVLLAAMVTLRDRGSADRRGVRLLIAGRVPGMVLGALAVVWLSTDGLAVAFAFTILALVGVSIAGVSLPQTTTALLGAGTMSGLMGTSVGVGGPPLALAYQRSSGSELRGTLAPIQTVGAALSLMALAVVGEFGVTELRWGLLMAPGMVVGFAVSGWVAPRLKPAVIRPAVLVFAIVSAVTILVRVTV